MTTYGINHEEIDVDVHATTINVKSVTAVAGSDSGTSYDNG